MFADKEKEVTKLHLEHQIELRKAILRLEENPDFIYVIKEAYLQQECAKAIKLSTYSTQDSNLHIARAQAAGYLEQFLSVSKNQGEQAESELLSLIQEDL